MNTKIIMSLSSVFLGAIGLLALFFPQEILAFFTSNELGNSSLIVSILGSVYLGFAFLNWNSRSIMIGGIYAKPLSLGNFVHFATSFITIIKLSLNSDSILLWVLTVLYGLLALAFGKITFTHPES
jgi:hypothetical protein